MPSFVTSTRGKTPSSKSHIGEVKEVKKTLEKYGISDTKSKPLAVAVIEGNIEPYDIKLGKFTKFVGKKKPKTFADIVKISENKENAIIKNLKQAKQAPPSTLSDKKLSKEISDLVKIYKEYENIPRAQGIERAKQTLYDMSISEGLSDSLKKLTDNYIKNEGLSGPDALEKARKTIEDNVKSKRVKKTRAVKRAQKKSGLLKREMENLRMEGQKLKKERIKKREKRKIFLKDLKKRQDKMKEQRLQDRLNTLEGISDTQLMQRLKKLPGF